VGFECSYSIYSSDEADLASKSKKIREKEIRAVKFDGSDSGASVLTEFIQKNQ